MTINRVTFEEFLKEFGGMEIVDPALRASDAVDKTHFDLGVIV